MVMPMTIANRAGKDERHQPGRNMPDAEARGRKRRQLSIGSEAWRKIFVTHATMMRMKMKM